MSRKATKPAEAPAWDNVPSWDDVVTGRWRPEHPFRTALVGYRELMAQEAMREMVARILREEGES